MKNTVMQYIDKAALALRKIGITIQPEPDAPILKILDAIPKEYDADKVLSIGKALQQQSEFNSIVRTQISGMEVANRQYKIVKSFDSIKKDAESMLRWMDDGKISLLEKVQNGWMKARRGSIPARFDDIKKIYLQVSKDASDQLTREKAVLEAYMDYRFALKESEIDAHKLFETATKRLEAAKAQLAKANDEAEKAAAGGVTGAAMAKLQLKRDESIRNLQDVDKVYQIIKDLTDNLIIAYNTAEVVFARLNQSSTVKERVYSQSVTFFATNEIVFTALSASLTSLLGLSESTKTLDAMKKGINEGLETVATVGNKQLEEGLRAGYGATIKADSVRSLVEAIVEFQSSSQSLIEELRVEATRNAKELEQVVNEGKERYTKLIAKVE